MNNAEDNAHKKQAKLARQASEDALIVQRLYERGRVDDVVLLADFVRWYCDAHHKDRTRTLLDSPGVRANLYDVAPMLCEDCMRYFVSIERKTALCRHDPKPFCSHCPQPCHTPWEKDYSAKVMRYAGPRSLFSRHWKMALRHLFKLSTSTSEQ